MGSVGDCYDNAMCESFFATLEVELLDRCCFHTRAEARPAIFTFIESWYNRQRRHESLGYLSPVEFEALYDPNLALDAARDERSRGDVGLEALRASSASQTPALS
jgi:transposase InsO family protein